MPVDPRLDVNVALNRPAYQSSTYTGNVGTHYAYHANDGRRTVDLPSLSCAHTLEETNPWWGVDLGVALRVHGVRFTNRDSCGTNSLCSVHI